MKWNLPTQNLPRSFAINMLPHGQTEYGVWALPDGAARYRFAVRHMTTTGLTPDQIHAMGLKQVADIEEQMLKVARSLGFQDLKSFNEHIRKDPDSLRKVGAADIRSLPALHGSDVCEAAAVLWAASENAIGGRTDGGLPRC